MLTVLSGTPLADVAAAEHYEQAELAEAVALYQHAGRDALERQEAVGWWQLYIEFADWRAAEQTAADVIAPLLRSAEQSGLISKWWFMRKHPCWRLRLHPGPDGQTMRDQLAAAFNQMVADQRITRWWPGIYEAETAAFGGPAGMEAAHDLFCADSRALMHLARDGGVDLGRRELSLLLCSALMRAAGLEWYEQGDAWHRVAQERPLPDDVPPAKLAAMAADLKQLMLADTTPSGPLFQADGPLRSAADWADAFRTTGSLLGSAARAGMLRRGLREVLAYAVIFHWNRLGLPARTQSILAWAARTAILDLPRNNPDPTAEDRAHVVPRSEPSAQAAATATQRASARFPLVPQRRFRCPDLETNVRNVRECANSCHEATTVDDRINRACTVLNLAALITADCGMPNAAINLCRQQFQIFRAAAPVVGAARIASLQPVINLARMTRRAGDPEGFHRELEAIGHALHHGGNGVIHGESIDFDRLIAGDLTPVDAWFRGVMRDHGTRALVAAGQWMNAAAHAKRYDDNTEQLREARQVRICRPRPQWAVEFRAGPPRQHRDHRTVGARCSGLPSQLRATQGASP